MVILQVQVCWYRKKKEEGRKMWIAKMWTEACDENARKEKRKTQTVGGIGEKDVIIGKFRHVVLFIKFDEGTVPMMNFL